MSAPPELPPLRLAPDTREVLRRDNLILFPAATQPFKIHAPPVASPLDRLEMVRLAVADDANYTVDDTEIGRKGLSFTVDTLEHLSKKHPGAGLFLLLGEDALAGLEQWRNPGRIRELATLAVMRRSGPEGSPVAPIAAGATGDTPMRVLRESTTYLGRMHVSKISLRVLNLSGGQVS